MTPASSGDFVFSRRPFVTKGDIESLLLRLKQNDNAAKKPLIDFIRHRLEGRYIDPLLNIDPPKFKSGFLMMAASCLMIEALQSFCEGWDDTNGCSEKTFRTFFEDNKEFFPGFKACFPAITKKTKGLDIKIRDNFYVNIRCGILHQAETTGGYSIVRDQSPLFDAVEKSVNADKFVMALQCCLEKYVKKLHESEINSDLWKHTAKKVAHICENCEG